MLSSDEINMLLEAIEIWKEMTPVESGNMVAIMNGIVTGDQEEMKAVIHNALEEAHRKRTSRKERGILLQAKLIEMRDKMDVSEAAEFLRKSAS